MNRVVVTGIGAVSPFGLGLKTLWSALLTNKNGISKLNPTWGEKNLVQVAGILGFKNPGLSFIQSTNNHTSINESSRNFLSAVDEAIMNSGLKVSEVHNKQMGIFICNHTPPALMIADEYSRTVQDLIVRGFNSQNNLFDFLEEYVTDISGLIDGQDSICHQVSRKYEIVGPQLNLGSACTSGVNAIGEAYFEIASKRLNCVIAGGAFDCGLKEILGLQTCGLLTTNSNPDSACRPFDKFRSGIVLGSGCGILVLESLDSAVKRKADILGEVTGFSSYTNPKNNLFTNAVITMKKALKMAGLHPEDISYVNASGTSGELEDKIETQSLIEVLGKAAYSIPVSATKSMIGHSMIASGAIEAVVCIQSLKEGIIHPTRNWKFRDNELLLDYTPGEPRSVELNHILSNNFGINGLCSSIVFSRFH